MVFLNSLQEVECISNRVLRALGAPCLFSYHHMANDMIKYLRSRFEWQEWDITTLPYENIGHRLAGAAPPHPRELNSWQRARRKVDPKTFVFGFREHRFRWETLRHRHSTSVWKHWPPPRLAGAAPPHPRGFNSWQGHAPKG